MKIIMGSYSGIFRLSAAPEKSVLRKTAMLQEVRFRPSPMNGEQHCVLQLCSATMTVCDS